MAMRIAEKLVSITDDAKYHLFLKDRLKKTNRSRIDSFQA
jgi:2-dehydro-3-deoxyphosphooctonate aldolase (KDO 8-P synthase)